MEKRSREELPKTVILLASEYKEKALFVCTVSKDLEGILHAGDIMGKITGYANGSGGGNQSFAQGGSKRVDLIDYSLGKVFSIVKGFMDGNRQDKS